MKKLFTSLMLSILFTLTGFAQSGELDLSFADDGILLMDVSGDATETSHDIIVQPDGKILVTMAADYDPNSSSFDFVVMRFHEDGTVDSTFAVDGVFHFENSNGSDIPYDMELLDDGSMLVVGSYAQAPNNTDFLILKITTDGVLDSLFGVDGAVIQSIDTGLDYGRGVTVTDDNQIVVCGYSHVPGFNYRHNALIKLDENGNIDSNFGNNGIFIWNDNNQTTNEMYAVRMAPDGGILTSGFAKPSATERIVLYKIQPDGSGLDPLFGNNGEVLTAIEGKGYGLLIRPEGDILVGGNSFDPNGSDYIILSFNQDGSPNTNFGTDGKFIADNDLLDYAGDIALQSDGKILIVGESGQGFGGSTPKRFTTVRCDADGILDTSWGGTGIVETITSDIFAFPLAITIQPADGKVLITGASATNTGNDLTIVRYGNFIDADMDGFSVADDCDDTNAAVNPDAVEVPYNGIDDDCDPLTPDDDIDGDGFPFAEDCDDMNEDINPDAVEIPDNGIDEDCDGMDASTGVQESELSQQFEIHPNPANNWVYISYDSNNLTPVLVTITDYTGKMLKVIKDGFDSNQTRIDLNQLPEGILILSIHTNEGIAVKRIVKN